MFQPAPGYEIQPSDQFAAGGFDMHVPWFMVTDEPGNNVTATSDPSHGKKVLVGNIFRVCFNLTWRA